MLGGAGDDVISTVLTTDTPDPTNTNFVLGDDGYILWTAAEFETLLGLPHWAGADHNAADIDLVASTTSPLAAMTRSRSGRATPS